MEYQPVIYASEALVILGHRNQSQITSPAIKGLEMSCIVRKAAFC